MDTVRNILQVKGNVVYTVYPESSVYDALELLEDKNLGSLVVIGSIVLEFFKRW